MATGNEHNTQNASYKFICKYVNASTESTSDSFWHKITSTITSSKFKRIALPIDICIKINWKVYHSNVTSTSKQNFFSHWIRHHRHYSVSVCGFIRCFFFARSSHRNVRDFRTHKKKFNLLSNGFFQTTTAANNHHTHTE